MTKCNAILVLVMASLFSMTAVAGEPKALRGVINVNAASADQLMLLPGVGIAKAQLIIEARTAKPFLKKEDLLEVKGIGEKLMAQWDPYLAFEGATSLTETTQAPVSAK